MPFQPKTAKDLPHGAEVQTFCTTIIKKGSDEWANAEGDPFTDAEVDEVLARGGILTRVPTGASPRQWGEILAEARTRVLTRNADLAEQSARDLRDRMPRFPEHAADMEADARACDDYVAACRAVATDHTLPTPSGPNYPVRGADSV
ncbi:hypothetical protein ACVCAH_11520 [Micromonospora sp. LZ34]